MEFGAELDGSQDYFQMFWPTILSHKIDQVNRYIDHADNKRGSVQVKDLIFL